MTEFVIYNTTTIIYSAKKLLACQSTITLTLIDKTIQRQNKSVMLLLIITSSNFLYDIQARNNHQYHL